MSLQELKQFIDYAIDDCQLIIQHNPYRCKHGKKFKEMAGRLNRTFGLTITPYLDLSNYKKRNGAPKLTYWMLQKIGYI